MTITVTRAQVVEATCRVLGRRESTQIFGDHREIGGLIADELGKTPENISRNISTLESDACDESAGISGSSRPSAPENNPLDELGVGVFVRRIGDWPIEVLARFDWACIAVIEDGRGKLNRDVGWWADARAGGVKLTAMDWLPPPAKWRTGLAEAVAWSAEHGSLCYVLDAEGPGPPKGWNGQLAPAKAFVAEARRLCDASRTGLGFTGFATLPPIFPGPTFLRGCADLQIPQPYDRHGAYALGYGQRSVDGYRKLGATRIAIGRGAFVDPDGVGPELARWRVPQEIERHRATTPRNGLVGEIWWPPAGTPRPRVVDAIVRR